MKINPRFYFQLVSFIYQSHLTMRILLISSILLCSLACQGQALLDSLKRNVEQASTDSLKAYWTNELSFHYRNVNMDTALMLNAEAEKLGQKFNWGDQQGNIRYRRAIIFMDNQQYDSALAIIDELITTVGLYPEKSFSNLYNLKGIIYRSNGQLENSLENFLKTLDLHIEQNDPRVVRTYGQLALLYNYMNDYPKALQYARKGALLVEKIDTLETFGIYNNLGVIHMGMKNYDSAIYYYDKDYYSSKYPEHSDRHGIYYHNIAYLLETQGYKKKGVDKFKEALKYKLKYNSNYSKSLSYHALAEAYYDWHVWGDKDGNKLKTALDSSLKYCQKALILAEQGGDIRMLMKVNGQISDIYAAKGESLKYYEYKNAFIKYKDSLFNMDRSQAVAEMDSKYQLKEKEAENLKLSNENLERQAVIRRQNTYFGIAAIIILLIGGMLILMYRSNKRIKALNAQIETSNKTKDRLFSIISHDLRGPISAFETTPKLLKNYLEKDEPEKVAEMVDHIDRSAKSINQLLDNLLNWSISQRQELVISIERLEIKPIIDEIISMFKDAAKLKSVNIECTITDQHILADRNTFATVVRNLLSNAIKFSHAGSTITIGHRISENWIEFTFSDKGTGMTEEQMEKLFVIDKSKVRSGTAQEKGTGLGLVLVKEFVEINKGEIRVESKRNEGTTFYVSLPLAS